MQKILIGIAGPAGAGKDTLATHLANKHNLDIVHFADPIKCMIDAVMGDQGPRPGKPQWLWSDRNWKESPNARLNMKSPRFAAQTIGTEWGRDLMGENFWLNAVMDQWFATGYAGIVVPDVRFNNEATWVRGMGTLVRIQRPGSALFATMDNAGHVSENSFEPSPTDITVTNPEDHPEVMFAMVDSALEKAGETR